MRVAAVLLVAFACSGAFAGDPANARPQVDASGAGGAGSLLYRSPEFRDAEEHPLLLDRPGKLYLIDFVAPGCKGCAIEAPELARLAHDLENTGRFQLVTVIVLGWRSKDLLSIGESLNTGALPLYADTEKWAEKLDVMAYPTKLLILDRRVLRRSVGGGPGAYTEWRAVIESQLKAKSASALTIPSDVPSVATTSP